MKGTDGAGTDNFSEYLKDRDRPKTLNERLKRRFLKALPAGVRKILDPDPEERLNDTVERFAAANWGAFFVQIGACDGGAGDPLREHVRAYEWRGIVVEPVPDNFARLVETYRDFPAVVPRNVAVGDKDGTARFYSIQPPEGVILPEWTRQIGSFDRGHIMKHAALHPGIEDYIAEIEVAALTFDSLVEETGETSIDFLHTDVEGYDYEILKQIDFNRWKPRMVLYEDFHIPAGDRAAARALLQAAGYDLLQGSMNVLAIRRGT